MQSSWLGRMVVWEAEELSKQSPLCGIPSHRKPSCPPSIPCLAMGSNYSCNMSLPSKIITNSSSVSEVFTWKVTPWLYILTSVNYLLWITRFCIKVKWLFTTLRTQWQENWEWISWNLWGIVWVNPARNVKNECTVRMKLPPPSSEFGQTYSFVRSFENIRQFSLAI